MRHRAPHLLIVVLLLGSLVATLPSCIDSQAPAAGGHPAAPGWFRGDFHFHTTHSDDARKQFGDDMKTSVELIEWSGLDFVSMTDHRTVAHHADPAFISSKTLLLAGEEWGSTAHAGLSGISRAPIRHSIDKGQAPSTYNAQLQAVIDDTHAQGGIFIINHPCSQGDVWPWDVRRYDAVEVWNRPWTFFNAEEKEQELDDTLAGLGLPAAGVAPSPWIRGALRVTGGSSNDQALAFWEGMLSDGIKVPAVGGGDRHMAFVPGHPSTYVLATSYDRAGVLEAVRKGRTWVGRGPDGARVDFRADADGDGVYEAALGDTLPLGGRIDFRVEVSGAKDGLLEVVQNGHRTQVPITSDTFVHTFSHTPGAYTWYRVDVFEVIRGSVVNGQDLANLIQSDPSNLVAGILSLITFARDNGFKIASVATALPTFVFEDDYDRILNLSKFHPGFCRGAITSPIYAGSR